MLLAPVTAQGFLDHVRAGFHARIPELGQLFGVPLSGDNGIHNRQAGSAGNVAENVLELQVHQRHGFLHMLHMLGCHFH